MTDKLTEFTADFSQTKQFKAEIEGAAINQEFTVKIYAPRSYILLTNYGSVTGKANDVEELEKVEIIGLNAEPQYPIKRLISKTTSNPIVSTDQHDLVWPPSAPLDGLDTERADLVGSIKIRYETFPAQTFTHSALALAGEYCLFAVDSNGCYQEIRFSISETGEQLDTIQILRYPMDNTTGFNDPYEKFIVFPASANPIVKVDIGTATAVDVFQYRIENEQISFSGKTANARFKIEAVEIPITGYFFDADNNHVSPSFNVIDFKLVADREIFGTCYISYLSTGVVYDYAAQVVGPVTTVGTAYAFHPKKKGIAATYPIPPHQDGKSNREDMIIIYSEVLVQGANRFEIPDNWDSDNSYVSYPAALEADKPVVGEAWSAWQRNHEIVFVENSGWWTDTPSVSWEKPTTGEPFPDTVYKFKSNIPNAPTDTISQSMIEELTAELDRLKTEYGIA